MTRPTHYALMSDAIAAIWRAAGDPSRWPDAMRATKPLMPECLGFAAFTPFAEGPGVIWQTVDPPDGFMDEYVARWLGRDATLHIVARRLPAEQLFIDHYAAPEFESCAVWQQLYVPHGIEDMSLLVANAAANGGAEAFMFGGFSERKIELESMRRRKVMLALAPHFSGCARLHWQLTRAESKSAFTRSLLDRLSLGIVMLNGQGAVLEMNQTARRLVDLRDGLVYGHGKIGATDVALQRALERAMASVIAGGAEQPLAIPREAGNPLTVIIAPAAVENAEVVGAAAKAFLFISDPERVPDNAGARIAALYGLTRAESEVAQALASGKDIVDIAQHRRTSVATARTQLKALMAKIGAARQSDVVRAVLAVSVLDPP